MNKVLSIPLSGDFIHTLHVSGESILALTEERHMAHYELKDGQLRQVSTTMFQHSVYDVNTCEGIQIVSCKDMPIRLYAPNLENSHINNCIASISDHKPNTEKFISPIRMSTKGNILTGGGRKILRSYDLSKFTKSREFKQFDKVMVSQVANSPHLSTLFVGDFSGNLFLVDTASAATTHQLKGIHQGAIMDIKTHSTNEYYFCTSARKDNFKYLWDTRNLSTFLQCYYSESSTNQRTDVWLEQSRLVSGAEKGMIKVWGLEDGELIEEKKIGKMTINCVVRVGDWVIVSEGERQFEGAEESRMIVMEDGGYLTQ